MGLSPWINAQRSHSWYMTYYKVTTHVGWFSFILVARADFSSSRHPCKGQRRMSSCSLWKFNYLLKVSCWVATGSFRQHWWSSSVQLQGAPRYFPARSLDWPTPNPNPYEAIFWLFVAYLKLFNSFLLWKISNIQESGKKLSREHQYAPLLWAALCASQKSLSGSPNPGTCIWR